MIYIKKLTIEYIRNKFEERGYTLISDIYNNSYTKLKYVCPNGHIGETTWNAFNSGRGCYKCGIENSKNKQKLSYDLVKSEFEKYGYELLSNEYVNNNTKLNVKCPNNHEYEVTYGNFQKGKRCPYCSNSVIKYEDVKKYIESCGYKLISKEYKNAKSKLEIECNHGHIYKSSWNNFRNGRRCSVCNDLNKINSYEKAKEFIENENYILLTNKDDFINLTNTRLTLKCPNEHIYTSKWGNFQQGNRCPYCNRSKGEEKISIILDNNDIYYISQYTFVDCIDKSYLPFDFYLPEYNLCIEYDGEQHFKPVIFKGDTKETSEIKYELTIKHDKIKNEYCKNNNINLIRIPYWEFNNIENILKQELNLD